MAKGIAVLQAAIAGQRVYRAGDRSWYRWNAERCQLVREDVLPMACDSLWAVWHDIGVIEPASMENAQTSDGDAR